MWMYDLAREQAPTLGDLRRFCDLTQESGYNAIGLYLEHRFAYPSTPWSHGKGCVTPEDIEVLQAEYKDLQIIPFINLLGHFEGFLYTVSISGKTNEENHYLKVNVQGNFAKERTPGKDEKPEDKEKLDKEFKEKTEKLQEKLKNEQKFDKWTYLVSKWSVDALLKERKDFLADKKDEKKEDTKSVTVKPADATAPPFDTIPPEIKNLVPPPPVPPAVKIDSEKKE